MLGTGLRDRPASRTDERAPDTLEAAAARLADLLRHPSGTVTDPGGSDLELLEVIGARPLARGRPPEEVWAVDGGQALVADARCVQVLVTRASRVCFRAGECVLEEEAPVRAHVVGGTEDRVALAGLGLGLPPATAVDAGFLRERWEWEAAGRCVEQAAPGALVLLDGDLRPDPRIPDAYVAGILDEARRRRVAVAAVTKHSSLSRGGAPLMVQLEMEAARELGERAVWWAPVGRTRPSGDDRRPAPIEVQVAAARLDPLAPFAFRVDIAAGSDLEETLGMLSAVSDDAGFPGYPYPLTVADRLAACPSWLRAESRMALDELLARAGIPPEVRERAFADRHRLMERS